MASTECTMYTQFTSLCPGDLNYVSSVYWQTLRSYTININRHLHVQSQLKKHRSKIQKYVLSPKTNRTTYQGRKPFTDTTLNIGHLTFADNGWQGEKKGKTKKQKIEYLKNEKNFLAETKNIFHIFWRATIWWEIKIW